MHKKPSYVRFDVPRSLYFKTYRVLERIRDSEGKIGKGYLVTMKYIGKNLASLVVIAKDVIPEFLVADIPLICEERGIPYTYVPSKDKLGLSCGFPFQLGCACVVKFGKEKLLLEDLIKEIKKYKK